MAGTPGGATTTQTFTAHGPMHNLDFNVVFKPAGGKGAKASPYIVAGGGYYHRSIEVTSPAVGYVPPYCNPWYYVCFPGGFIPVDKVVGHRSSDDFGIDVGGGVDVKMGDSAILFFDSAITTSPARKSRTPAACRTARRPGTSCRSPSGSSSSGSTTDGCERRRTPRPAVHLRTRGTRGRTSHAQDWIPSLVLIEHYRRDAGHGAGACRRWLE